MQMLLVLINYVKLYGDMVSNMEKTKRIYISLNPNKPKDNIIQKFLESTYNEAETIKAILYQHAVNGSSLLQTAPNINMITNDSLVNKGAESNVEEQNDAVSSIKVDNDIINMFN